MALSILPGDQKEESRNVGQADYDRKFNEIARLENDGTFNDIKNNYGNTADSAQENQNIEKARQQEAAGSNNESEFKNNYGSEASKQPLKFKGFMKKRGGIIGLIIGMVFGGGLFAGFFGSASMFANLASNLMERNDSSSTAMERRFLKAFGFATGDPICANNSKLTLSCKMGRISNAALKQLSKKGVVAVFDGVEYDGKRTGYPNRNPTHYIIVGADGKKGAPIEARNLTAELRKDPKLASKVLGVRGAFSMRMKAWSGNYMKKAFFSVFGLNKGRGNLDVKSEGNDKKERLANLQNKIKEKIPGIDKAKAAVDGVKSKVDKQIGKAKKGGIAYTASVAACIGVKAPSIIAGAVAAVQLAQVLPFVSNYILQPGSAQKAAGLEGQNSLSPEDMDVAASALTERTPNKDGDLKSALDSQILQQQLGVNSNKAAVAPNYTPGVSMLAAMASTRKYAKDTEPACNAIMSPAAMWSAFAVDSAVTVALSPTILGGIIKVAASFIISEVVAHVAGTVITDMAKGFITDLATNDAIPNAKGEELGDVLGISSAAFFSSGGQTHGLNGLSMSQLSDYAAIQKENEEFNRNMDIASLSPFDISSKYTFMGSIVRSIQNVAIANPTITGFISNMASLPFSGVKSVSALEQNTNNCSYANYFGLNAENEGDSPAINIAGLPCTGMTKEQSTMSTETAIELLQKEGWLDMAVEISPADTITELVGKGVIKPETPLMDYIDSCMNASSGDYFYNAASCIAPGTATSTNVEKFKQNNDAAGGAQADYTENADKDATDAEYSGSTGASTGILDQRSYQAMAVFLLDYQIIAGINGEDDIPSGSGNSNTTPPDLNIDDTKLYEPSDSMSCATGTTDAGVDDAYRGGVPFRVKLCALPNTVEPERGGPGLVNARASAVAFAMFEGLRTQLGVDKITLNDSFRTMAQQQEAKRIYGGQAATPGYSNHQSGYAFDINMGAANGGNSYSYRMDVNTSYPGNPVWEWLKANAEKYHYFQYSREGWHWSINGE